MIEQDAFRLDSKVALITGSARGIGAECARVLAAAGATVMVTDVLTVLGRETTASISAVGGKAHYLDLDVTSEGAWESVIDATVGLCGGLDVLVNNAGIEIMGPIIDLKLEDFQRIMSINVDGVMLGMKQAILAMRQGGRAGHGGSIINMSSVAGMIGVPWLSAYGATKGAVRIMTKDVAVECGRLGYGIRCNSIHPGVVDTEMAESFYEKNMKFSGGATREQIQQAFLAAHPIGRIGVPRDIANAVRFLASDASSWITGVELPVDGGWTAT